MSVFWVVMSYLLGSIPFGLLISKKFCGIDPRLAGSKNVGSTNVARLCGKRYGLMTLICDIAKGALPVAIASCMGCNAFYISILGLASILGHLFSCFLGFKGGKAVATSIGVFLPIAFCPLLISAIICVGTILYSGFVSLGSISLAIALPIFLLLFGQWNFIPLALCVLCIVIWSHSSNIQRLCCGMEKTWKKKEYQSH